MMWSVAWGWGRGDMHRCTVSCRDEPKYGGQDLGRKAGAECGHLG